MKVFSLGGSILTKNLDTLPEYAETFNSLQEQKIVVTGAGDLKKYIENLSGNHAEKDLVGIKATRLNASALATEAGANSRIPETAEELKQQAKTGQDIYMGGLTPGYSTDAVAAIAAELFNAPLYIASDVKGVYNASPEKENAELLENVTVEQLRELSSSERKAGKHSLIDPTALEIIERSGIKTKFLKGEPDNLAKPAEAEGTTLQT